MTKTTITWGISHFMKKGKDLPANIMRDLRIIQSLDIAEKRFGKKNFFHADIGQPLDQDLLIHKVISQGDQYATDFLKKNSDLRGYTSPLGLAVLRQSFVNFYKKYWHFDIDANTLLVSNGASEMWNSFVHSSLWPGDLVLATDPHYNPFDVALSEAGAGWVVIETKAENGFHFTKKDFENTLKKQKQGRIRAVYINSPSNPTGVIYSREEIDMFVDYALKNDLYIVMDAVYSLYNYSSNPTLIEYLHSVSNEKRKKIYQNLVFLDSMSKLAHNPGVRIGFGLIPNEKIRNQIFSDLSIRGNVQNHGQIKSSFVLDKLSEDRSILDSLKKLYKKKMSVIYKTIRTNLMEKGVIPTSPCPEGSLYITIKTGFDNLDFFIWVMTKYTGSKATSFVPLTVGQSSFRAVDSNEGKKELRLCIGSDINLIPQAVTAFVNQLIAYKKYLS
ncbi:MAG: Aspartate aminotransferase [Candidatus Roizmanbacteria bacterium GW2011_GWC2_37_13]|uniref:Aspartate aminotransferase n=1 Tax=Candidatus Roizmanbacteria bacterium GW2011_GWC2_37_13 TaxID=1618486 RepID=A0A0G0JAH1_9BACT|nr:MAG: Aspartate aminotransferase [Candidatus Roizmanbacteria bacterium GW2011_GWC1_37_12]KKQ25231.1 MAG: Aspartate aminotransferase [Candidatus Roizmanbacteria bacterium GW2011_GWC2_37_13]